MTRLSHNGDSILRELMQDRAGNTLAMAAASLLPLMALIGGGVDVSRSYMAKTQLQAACDAGVLAGRRAMSKSGTYGAAEKAKADRMFEFNFDDESLDVQNISYVTTDNDEGQVLGTAKARVPTLVMKIFEMDNTDLEVDCMAELQIGNADVMFVLDTTGSMGGSRISGLRQAVKDFHMTVNQAVNDDQTRIRYGFVPYSVTVNAKDLVSSGAMSTDYFTSATPYQTRVAQFQDEIYVSETEDLSTTYETYHSEIQQGDCYDYGDNRYPSWGWNPVTDGSPPETVTSTEYDYVGWNRTRKVKIGRKRRWVGWCTRRVHETRTTYETQWGFSGWSYEQAELDTSNFKALASVPIATNISSATVDTRGNYDVVRLAQMNGDTAQNVGTTSYTWSGCIEERETTDTSTTVSAFDPVPDDAYDLNLDLTPFDDDTRWRPLWQDVEYKRSGSKYSTACPQEMMLLREVEMSDDPEDIPGWLNTYLTNLSTSGNTYHDIGMIWGGRLISSKGIFADNVNLDADTKAVSRHVIFMTDGEMYPNGSYYTAYGAEELDHRVAPDGYSSRSDLIPRHNVRFSAACEEVKAGGATVWVIAFGTSMTTELENCASNGRSYYSSNTEALRNTFKFIASQVADLRLGE